MANITAQLDGATNVLLKVPPLDEGRDICTSLLGDGERSVLFVSFTRQAAACVDQVADDPGIRTVGVITVGDTQAGVDREGVVTENVSTASDLTGLGIEIGKFLSEWDEPVSVCFESLTSMLQYVDYETAYEFLHAVTGQVHAAGARAHFHVDPDAHDRKTISKLKPAFHDAIRIE